MNQHELNSHKDKMDLLFSDKLGNASAQPPQRVWDDIEKSLDEKNRRRFFWWIWGGISLPILIGVGFLLPFVLSETKESSSITNKQTKTEELSTNKTILTEKEKNSNTEESSTPSKEISKETNTETNTETSSITNKEETKTVEKTLIQLGAFKNEVSSKVFSNVSYPVVVQKGNDGYIRYFAEIESEPAQAIQTLKEKGFASVYINTHINKNIPFESLPEVSPTIAQQTKEINHTNESRQANSFASANSAPAKTQHQNKAPVSTTNAQPIIMNEALETKQNTPQSNTNIDAQTTSVASINTTTENKQAEEKVIANETNTEINNVPVKDTAMIASTNEEKKDSSDTKKSDKALASPVSSLAKKDSLKNEPYTKWALSVEGGPLLFIKNVQTNLFNTSNEKEVLSYNSGLKAAYSFSKYLSLIVGANYSTFIAKQDATYFYFPKNITTDYTFYNSYGSMSANSSTLLSGFSPAPWITTLQAQYAYTTQVSYLSVPIQANLTYLRTKRITLFINAGINSQFAVAQQNHLQIIKEHETDHVDNNNITVNKFAFSLVAGLGCDIKLFKHIYFTAAPGFVYGFTNLSNTTGIKNTPQYFMGNAGLKIKW